MIPQAYLENADTHNLVCPPAAGIWGKDGGGKQTVSAFVTVTRSHANPLPALCHLGKLECLLLPLQMWWQDSPKCDFIGTLPGVWIALSVILPSRPRPPCLTDSYWLLTNQLGSIETSLHSELYPPPIMAQLPVTVLIGFQQPTAMVLCGWSWPWFFTQNSVETFVAGPGTYIVGSCETAGPDGTGTYYKAIRVF